MKQPQNQRSSPLNCEIVAVVGRYFRKQSIDSSEQGTYLREKKEARENARTFASDDKGWRNDAVLRKRREEEDNSNGEDDFDGTS